MAWRDDVDRAQIGVWTLEASLRLSDWGTLRAVTFALESVGPLLEEK